MIKSLKLKAMTREQIIEILESKRMKSFGSITKTDFPYIADAILALDEEIHCVADYSPNILHVHHKHIYYKNGKRVYPKKHRCKCIYYLSGTYSKNNCKVDDRRESCSMVYPKCIGVNCGYYIYK